MELTQTRQKKYEILFVWILCVEIKTCEIIENMRYVGVDLFLEIITCGLNMELTSTRPQQCPFDEAGPWDDKVSTHSIVS